jgi:hypothetical protein
MNPNAPIELAHAAVANDYLPVVYGVYAAISSLLTIWLARTLGKNGSIFLKNVFKDDAELGDAVNRLLVVGFYLVNFGYACLHLVGGHADSPRRAMEVLAEKLGSLLLVLAAMHFANLFVFNRIRKNAARSQELPPFQPQARLPLSMSSLVSQAGVAQPEAVHAH